MREKDIRYFSGSVLKGLVYSSSVNDAASFETVAENRGTRSVGVRYFTMIMTENTPKEYIDYLNLITQTQNVRVDYNFKVDSRLLKNQFILDFIRERGPLTVTITNSDYSIRLSYDYFVNNVNTNFQGIESLPENVIADRANCEICPSFFTTDYGYNYDLGKEESYFIKKELTDSEIDEVIAHINSNIERWNNNNVLDLNHKLYIRFFKPELYSSFIKKLYDRGLNKDVKINILGYPLNDKSDQYESLMNYSSNIEVSYMSCRDLIDCHCGEPYATANRYRSELEADGITDLNNYVTILNYMREYESRIRPEDDDLTKAVVASNFMKERYTYDHNYRDTDAINAGINRNIDSVVNRDAAVCEGFANLYSLLLRRVGVPVFVYGTHVHARNIGRIRRKDKNGKVIEDKICTFDFTNENFNIDPADLTDTKQFNYFRFALSPDAYLCLDHEYLTLANSLIVDRDSYERNCDLSVDNIEAAYTYNYEPLSYLYSMLRIMGYGEVHGENELFALIRGLNDNDRIGSIDPQAVVDTVVKVLQREGTNVSKEEIESEVKRSIDNRIYYNGGFAHLIINGINSPSPDNITADDLTIVSTYNNRVYNYVPFSEKIDVTEEINPEEQVQMEDDIHLDEINGSLNDDINSVNDNSGVNDSNDVDSNDEGLDNDDLEIVRERLEEAIRRYEELINAFRARQDEIRESNYSVSFEDFENEWLQSLNDAYSEVVYWQNRVRELENNIEIEMNNNHVEEESILNDEPQFDRVYSGTNYGFVRDQIIQDLPLNSTVEQTFNAQGMSDDEIKVARDEIRTWNINGTQRYRSLLKDEIIQDLPYDYQGEQEFDSIGMSDEEIMEAQEVLHIGR